jgi:hypothetical protein
MQANVQINKLNSGKVQISVSLPHQMSRPVLDFPSPKEAKAALLAFGIDSITVEEKLALLAEIRPKELLRFPEQDINDDALRANGFRL